MAPNSQETPKQEQQEAPLIPSPISGQQPKDSPVAQSKEEEKSKELTPIKESKPAAKKKKDKEPQVTKDGERHITIK
jgi:hypothetical protein